MKPGRRHRADIDGLRAVAVLSVILFHIDPHWLPGGFVGVDIFFVISGYLITGILMADIQAGRFSLLNFYERRVRRILPALWVVLLVSLPVSWWLMLPRDAEPMAKSALWAILAMGNVFFWRDVATDYFAPQSAEMPFLHLWSLGVEEQFYFFWPLALMAALRIGRRRGVIYAAALAGAVLVFSTLLADVLLAKGLGRFAYYMIPTRAGELALGAVCAISVPKWASGSGGSTFRAHVLTCIGWILILFSLFWLNERQPFPGWRSLVPTMGAAALIVSGYLHGGGSFLGPLTCLPAQWLGRCSYSAYLWHWPLLAWWRYLWGQPGLLEGLALLAAILLLADLSRAWVEDPARRLQAPWPKTLVRFAVLPAVGLGAIALVMARGNTWGWPVYSDVERKRWAQLEEDTRPAHRVAWVCQQNVLDPRSLRDPQCEFGSGSTGAEILLLGDSHAAHFAPMFRRAAELQGARVRSVALGACAPLPGPLAGVVSPDRVAPCEAGVRQVLARARDFKLLVVGGAWTFYAGNSPDVYRRFEEFLREVTADGRRVWLLPRVTRVKGYDAACAAKSVRVGSWLRCPIEFEPSDANDTTNPTLERLAARIPGVRFLPVHRALCDSPKCTLVDPDGRFLYSDPGHLSVHGAEYLADVLIRVNQLPDLTRP